MRKITFVITLFVLVFVIWTLGHFSVKQAPLNFPVLIETLTSCKTLTVANKNELIVFTPSKAEAQLLTQKLCKDSTVARQYGSVVGYWGYKTADSVEFVGKGIADIILAKNNIMAAFKAEITYNYQPVAGFADYAAFFISSKEKPIISKQYFLDKKIGLLDYPTSRSGHILPKQIFKQLNINLSHLDITYASSHNELRQLLANGEVDIISSFWKESDASRFSKNYITAISNKVSGTRWYLKMQHNNTDLLCAVQTLLLTMSKEQPLHYYQDVQPYWRCDKQGVVFLGAQSHD
jgi:hypothetical protein